MVSKPVNFASWIESIRHELAPPVGNKLLFGAGQHKVMVVGGPNVRRCVAPRRAPLVDLAAPAHFGFRICVCCRLCSHPFLSYAVLTAVITT